MKRLSSFAQWSLVILISLTLIDLKNIILHGEADVVSGDILDTIKFYATFPGYIAGFLVALFVYRNIHDYSFYVVESISIIASAALYEWIISTVVKKLSAKQNGVRLKD